MFKNKHIPWNKGKTAKTDKRVARPWLNKHRSKETKQKLSEAHKGTKKPWVTGNYIKGHKHSEETKKKLSNAKLGNKNPMKKADVKLKVSESLKKAYKEGRLKNGFQKGHGLINGGVKGKHWKLSDETRKKMSVGHKGENCIFWKGGITNKNKKIRNTIEFRLWREAVFARDNWACQGCNKIGGELHAHHIKRFSKYPELRFAIDNGIKLCYNCHIKKHIHKF